MGEDIKTDGVAVENISENGTSNKLKDIVKREDATSEEVKQTEIASLRMVIDKKKNIIEQLLAANRKKKIAIVWLSIVLGLIIITVCGLAFYYYKNSGSLFSDNGDTPTEMVEEIANQTEQVQQPDIDNDDKAQLLMGQKYYSGTDGVKQDYQQALEWFSRSANNGNLTAMKLLANMYENGEGVEKSTQSAFKYYFSAARLGDREALYKVGKFYYNGTGVDKNTEKALVYLNQSAKQGYNPAVTLLEIIRQENKPKTPATETITTKGE